MRTKLPFFVLTISFLNCLSFLASGQPGVIVDSIQSRILPYATGIACAGTNLWITGSPLGFIYKISNSGQVLDSITDPAALHSDYSQGIAYDGTHLWVSCYSCDSLYKIEIASKHVTGIYGGLNPDERVSIAYNGHDKLYFANGSNLNGGAIFDIPSHTFSPWGGSVFARGFVFINHKLYGTDASSMPNQSHIFEVDTTNGTKILTDDWCVHDPFGGLGMSYDGNHVWQSSVNSRYIYNIIFNPTTLDVNTVPLNGDFSIFNNPVHDELKIFSADNKLHVAEIYDAPGRMLENFKFISDQVIDVSAFSKGIYFMKIYSGNNNMTVIKKFIVD